MEGSFGYEAEHHVVSMNIGEFDLFPAVRGLAENIIVAAPGTSYRHQIHDRIERQVLHPGASDAKFLGLIAMIQSSLQCLMETANV